MPLTKETHCKRWKKAKECMASSLSRAHFGHCKASTHDSDLSNSIHMALSAIPLNTGFSYNKWLNRVNGMLEKSPEND